MNVPIPKIAVSIQVEGLVDFYKAAEILQISRPHIYWLIETGKLHRIDILGTSYVPLFEVEAQKKNGKSKNA